MSEMALTADHLVVIGQGRLLADTSMAEFIRQNSRSYVRMRTPRAANGCRTCCARPRISAATAGDGTVEIEGGERARSSASWPRSTSSSCTN